MEVSRQDKQDIRPFCYLIWLLTEPSIRTLGSSEFMSGYNTPDTVVKHRPRKVGHEITYIIIY